MRRIILIEATKGIRAGVMTAERLLTHRGAYGRGPPPVARTRRIP